MQPYNFSLTTQLPTYNWCHSYPYNSFSHKKDKINLLNIFQKTINKEQRVQQFVEAIKYNFGLGTNFHYMLYFKPLNDLLLFILENPEEETVKQSLMKKEGYLFRLFFSGETWEEWINYKNVLGSVTCVFVDYITNTSAGYEQIRQISVNTLVKANEKAKNVLIKLGKDDDSKSLFICKDCDESDFKKFLHRIQRLKFQVVDGFSMLPKLENMIKVFIAAKENSIIKLFDDRDVNKISIILQRLDEIFNPSECCENLIVNDERSYIEDLKHLKSYKNEFDLKMKIFNSLKSKVRLKKESEYSQSLLKIYRDILEYHNLFLMNESEIELLLNEEIKALSVWDEGAETSLEEISRCNKIVKDLKHTLTSHILVHLMLAEEIYKYTGDTKTYLKASKKWEDVKDEQMQKLRDAEENLQKIESEYNYFFYSKIASSYKIELLTLPNHRNDFLNKIRTLEQELQELVNSQ